MDVREALASTILEISSTEESEGGFFPFFIADYDSLKLSVRRPLGITLPYIPHGGYDGSAGTRFLIVGDPESGKTREALEIIGKLDRLRPRTIIYSLDGLQLPNKIPSTIKKDSSVVLFIDDFGRDMQYYKKRPPVLSTRGGFPRPLDKLQVLLYILEQQFADLVVVITISTEDYKLLKKEDEGQNVLLQFKTVVLGEFNTRQIERSLEMIVKTLHIGLADEHRDRLLKVTFNSIAGLCFFFHTLHYEKVPAVTREHAHQYYEMFQQGWSSIIEKFDESERYVIQALGILRKYLIIPHRDLVIEVAREIDSSFSLQKKKKVLDAITRLTGRVIFECDEHLLCYDALLPEKDVISLEQLAKILLSFSKKKRDGTRIRQSLLNITDRLLDMNILDLNIQINSRLLELLPNYAECYYNLGILKASKGQTDEAEKYFLAMIEKSPQDPLVYYNYAVFLSHQRKIEEAHQQYLKAIELAPNDADIQYKLAQILMSLGKRKEAEEAFVKGIDLNPFDAAARNNFGVLLKSLNKTSQAEHHYRQAIDIDPTYAKAYKNLGTLLFSQGRTLEAERLYKKSIELDPTDAMTFANLGILLRARVRDDEAEEAFRKAIELDSNYAKTFNNLGVLLFDHDRLDDAEKMFTRAIQIDKDYKDAHYNLTLVYEKKGDSEKAIQHWEAITRSS